MTDDVTNLDYIQIENPDLVSMEDALTKAFASLELDRMGGASPGYGWSRYSRIQRCPRLYQLRYEKKIDTGDSKGMSVGSVGHALLALYYDNFARILREEPVGPSCTELRDALLDAGADAEAVAEGWRCFEAYADHYEGRGDYLTPLAIEYPVVNSLYRSCRYDLLAMVTKEDGAQFGVLPGTYIVEHKFLRQLDRSTTETWDLHGEVLGQIILYQSEKLAKKFGKLRGVIANITTKHKVPRFHREVVAVDKKQLKRQKTDLDHWDNIVRMYRTFGYWPRALAACSSSKYGVCEYYDYCRENSK